MLTRSSRHAVVLAALVAAVVVMLLQPPIAQDPAYHRFADRRTVMGVTHGLDVLSNTGFAIAGLLGLATVLRLGTTHASISSTERWAYLVLFAGTLLTAVGSAYYHLAPDNGRLVWDRLPMTVGFMGLVAAVVAERVSVTVSRRLLVPLLLIGAASVGYWHWSEVRGAGDLRVYGLVQFGSLLIVMLLLVVYPSFYADTWYLWAALAVYGAAKLFEALDGAIFDLGGIVSGHTLKHLTAAGAIALVVAMLRRRRSPGRAPVI